MRVLICGSRDWDDRHAVFSVLDGLRMGIGDDPDFVVIHGAARGADMLAAEWCKAWGNPEMRFPADWDRYGKRAGYVRNARMLDEGKPDMVYGFMNEPATKGTTMMLDLAKKAGVPTYRIQGW